MVGWVFFLYIPSFLLLSLFLSLPLSFPSFQKKNVWYLWAKKLSHFYWRHTSWTFEHLHPHQEGNTPKMGSVTALLAVTQSTRYVPPKMQRWKFPLSPWLVGECDRLHFPKISEPMYPLMCQCDLGTLPLRGRFCVASSWTLMKLTMLKVTLHSFWNWITKRIQLPPNPSGTLTLGTQQPCHEAKISGKAYVRSQPTVGSNC